jgi:transposase
MLNSRIAETVRAHPDGEVLLSLFRDPGSTLTAAKLLSEIGDRRERYPTAETLAADAGMCPVAKESGKRKVATFRRACNKRLRYILATLADSSRQHNPWAKDIYLRARGRGCDHPHAIRVLGRAWVRVIWRMWQDGVPYDPLKHSGRRRLNAA